MSVERYRPFGEQYRASKRTVLHYLLLVSCLCWMTLTLQPNHTALLAQNATSQAGITHTPAPQTSVPAMVVAKPNLSTANEDDEVVYLDANGYIRIWNPLSSAGTLTVQWVSPIGGWRDFALIDVNQDDDMEIVAIGGESTTGRLTIYDPVLLDRAAVRPDRIINDIPWDILYETALLGRPLLVKSGELNPAIPGDEIAFVFSLNAEDRIDPDDETRISFLQQVTDGSASPNGRAWESAAADRDFGNTWERMALGDLDGDGLAEIALVDDGVGLVRVYRLEEDAPVKIYDNESGERPWQDVTVAQFIPSTLQQLSLARASNFGGSTLWVLYYNPADETGFSDSYAELLLPTPRVIFHGDINGNGDDELFLLRQVPSNQTKARLIMRNAGDDTLPVFEPVLDVDNGFLAGAAGDSDGDGRDEVAIMRDNQLRIYTSPESDVNAFENFTPPAVTNQRSIALGNLDRNGYLELPRLSALPLRFDIGLAAGDETAFASLSVSNGNADAPGPITFAVETVGEPAWLIVEPRNGTTASAIQVKFDARYLTPGTYRSQIIISTTDQTVRNMPLAIDVVLSVSAGLMLSKYAIAAPYNCDNPTQSLPYTSTITLNGPDNLAFSAKVIDSIAVNHATHTAVSQQDHLPVTASSRSTADGLNAPRVIWPSDVPWATAVSPNVLPATMQVRFDPSALTSTGQTAEAALEIVFANADGQQTRLADLILYCANHRAYLPLIAR